MALAPGTQIGPYEIAAQIGVGGMGEVYRATDSRLKRQVAIKVLPAPVASDAERLTRFQREAEVLAQLNHPNIAAIYGLEAIGDAKALVLELVEGPTLADRIAQGAIPAEEALLFVRQIADGLEAAHERGIIHRDLKPANIKVRPDGTVKVLDFGLAKAIEPAAVSSQGMSQSPTITTPAMTQAGMMLGTAAYMSPEQARGSDVDRRADLWALGVVLWEMLTRKRPFEGPTVSDTLAAVLRAEPDWAILPAGTSAPVRRLLRRCLEKDRRRRLDSASVARLEIEEAQSAGPVNVNDSSAMPAARASMPWVVAAFSFGALLAALATWALLRPTRIPPETRLEIGTPSTSQPTDFALSPDGRQIVFAASGDGPPRLWLRALASTDARPLPGTESGTAPFWSPDSRSIAFFASGQLKRLDLNDTAPQNLVRSANGNGGTWSADGDILYSPGLNSPVMRVPAAGGEATTVTKLGASTSHRWPQWLPDNRQFLFHVAGAPDTTGIYLGSLDGSRQIRLTAADAAGMYVPATAGRNGQSGWLLWVREGVLIGQRLDAANAVLSGEIVRLASGVPLNRVRGAVSVSNDGLIAYRTGAEGLRQLMWFDRSGAAKGTLGDPESNVSSPRVSPDGKRVAVQREVQGNADIWLLDEARASRFRLTSDPATDSYPFWSRDGTSVVFRSRRTGGGDLYLKRTVGAGREERLVASPLLKTAVGWSGDGRVLLYQSSTPSGVTDLWTVPMTGSRAPTVFLQTSYRTAWPAVAPDGRWVAYMSDESGRPEIYVRRFIAPGVATTGARVEGQWQVSTAGGVFSTWRPDGRELYYLSPDGSMMAVPIAASGDSLEQGPHTRLFTTRVVSGGVDRQQGRQYDVAPDGRFLVNTELDSADAPITLIQNWNPEASR